MRGIDVLTAEEEAATEHRGFAVFDNSTSLEKWQYAVRPIKYYLDANGVLCGRSWGKRLFVVGQSISFHEIERIIFPDAESASTAAVAVARDTGRDCGIDVFTP